MVDIPHVFITLSEKETNILKEKGQLITTIIVVLQTQEFVEKQKQSERDTKR